MVSVHADRRLASVLLVLAAAVLALAGSAWSKSHAQERDSRTLRGTGGNDVLRGGAQNDILEGLAGNDSLYGGGGADRLYGSGGNDLLSGGAGDDMLAGGPGRDRFSCGPGHDVVYASASSTVSRDCEVVHRAGSPAPSPGVSTGAYRGDTVSFDLSPDAKTVSNLRIDFTGACPPAGNAHIQVSDSGPFPVHADRTFNANEQRAGGEKVTLNGVLDNGGAAHGTFELKTTAGGFSCDTGSVSWRAHH